MRFGDDHLLKHGGDDDDHNGVGGVFDGSGGSVKLEGGAGADIFVFATVADSTSTTFDTIDGFDPTQGDQIFLPETITGVDAAVTGHLSTATFDADLAKAIGATQLAAGHAVVFTPVEANGTADDESFLVVDANGQAGYQAGQDFVIKLDDAANLSSLSTANFITGTTPPAPTGQHVENGDDHNNTMKGTGQDDHMDGHGGNDTMQGANGNDSMNGGAGNDHMVGGNGDDVLVGATGNDFLQGGNGNDTLDGNDGNDTLDGQGGHDTLNGGAGADQLQGGDGDTFVYGAASDSTGSTFDTIKGFDLHHGDHIDLTFVVTGVDTALTHGNLSMATFDADLSAAVGTHLGANHAMVFTASGGDLRHDTFLVIDANGQAGYQPGSDLVIRLDNANHIQDLSTSTFI
jgi:Ca2+-binding RTX toxin-like protein